MLQGAAKAATMVSAIIMLKDQGRHSDLFETHSAVGRLCECWVHRYCRSCSKVLSPVQNRNMPEFMVFSGTIQMWGWHFPSLKAVFCFMKDKSFLLAPSAICNMTVFSFFDAAVIFCTALHTNAFVNQCGVQCLLNWVNLWMRIWRTFMKKHM